VSVKDLVSGEEKKGVKCRTKECNGRIISTKKCPIEICNETLPDSLFDTTKMSFSLIGSSGSGKTNYITVLLTEMKKRSKNLKFSLMPKTTETRSNYTMNFKTIYEDKMPLGATAAGSERPSIWTIANLNKKSIGGRAHTYVLNLFDGAGETHKNLDSEAAKRDARYIEHSDAIIFVIDPLRFKSLRELSQKIDSEKSMSSSAEDTDEDDAPYIISNTADMIRGALRKKSNQKIDKHVAIIISKMDLFLGDEFFQGGNFLNDSPHAEKGYFDMADCEKVDEEITQWLRENEEEEFLNILEENFYFNKSRLRPNAKKCFLFGASAFGNAPDSDGSLPNIHARRVLDPILWLLAQQGFIDKKK
jgi:GTPase SAR1 family protein